MNITKAFFTVVLFFFSCQEFPDQPVRDNPLDSKAEFFDFTIKEPVEDSSISSNFSIVIESQYLSSQNNLQTLEIFYNDSLLESSSKIPFVSKQNAELFPRGSAKIKCLAKGFDGREIVKEISIFNRSLEITISESNNPALNWKFGAPLTYAKIFRSLNKDMSDATLLFTATNDKVNSYTDPYISYGEVYYQVTAHTNDGRIIYSNQSHIIGNLIWVERLGKDNRTYDVDLDSNGNIFAATEKGLYVYTYNNSSYTLCCNSDNVQMKNCAISASGTIFTANIHSGLSAFTFNQSSLVQTANLINDSYNEVVACGDENVVFLGNADGLWAYEYTGSSFQLIDHIDDATVGVHKMSIGSDGIIFTANSYMGLFAYKFDGIQFTNIAYVDDSEHTTGLATGDEGTVFLGNYERGLWVYNFNGFSFNKIGQFYTNGDTGEIALDAYGNIIVSSGSNSLNIFRYDSNSLQKIAVINNAGSTSNITISNKNKIYLAQSRSGISVCTQKWSLHD